MATLETFKQRMMDFWHTPQGKTTGLVSTFGGIVLLRIALKSISLGLHATRLSSQAPAPTEQAAPTPSAPSVPSGIVRDWRTDTFVAYPSGDRQLADLGYELWYLERKILSEQQPDGAALRAELARREAEAEAAAGAWTGKVSARMGAADLLGPGGGVPADAGPGWGARAEQLLQDPEIQALARAKQESAYRADVVRGLAPSALAGPALEEALARDVAAYAEKMDRFREALRGSGAEGGDF